MNAATAIGADDHQLRTAIAGAARLPALQRELADAKSELERHQESRRQTKRFDEFGPDPVGEEITGRIRTLHVTITALEHKRDRATSALSRREYLGTGESDAKAALAERPKLLKALVAAEKDVAQADKIATAVRAELASIDERRKAAIAAAGSAAYAALASGSAAPRDTKTHAADAERETMMATLKIAEDRRAESDASIRGIRDALIANRTKFLGGRARAEIERFEAMLATTILPTLAAVTAAARLARLTDWLPSEFEPAEADIAAAEQSLLAEIGDH